MVNFQIMFLLKMIILSLHEALLQMVNFQTMLLLKMTILSLHEAQAPNGEFTNNVLIENVHSEPPRGAGSQWVISKQCSH